MKLERLALKQALGDSVVEEMRTVSPFCLQSQLSTFRSRFKSRTWWKRLIGAAGQRVTRSYPLPQRKVNAMDKKMLFTGGTLSEADVERIKELGFDLIVARADLTEDELVSALDGVHIYILGGAEKATARVLDSATSLQILAFFGAGYQSFVDTDAATRNGICVTYTPGANARSVAEFTMALMLDAAKRLTYLIERTKGGDWPEYRAGDLANRTLGLIGIGNVGTRVAAMASKGFDMRVLYTALTRKPDIERDLGVTHASFDELLTTSDVISVHATYGPETIGLIGASELQKMKRNGILINCARAELVDPAALCAALENRQIGIAAFDGYYIEPVPSPQADPFGLIRLSSEQFIVSPHTAYLTSDSMTAMLDMSLTSISNLYSTGHDNHIANPGYAAKSRI